MTLGEELEAEVKKIFSAAWTVRDGEKVPDTEDIQLGNVGVNLDATVLYADLAQSTALVTGYIPKFAAEVYKTYLYCAARIITSQSGVITSYDGDRIMAVFIGGLKNTQAATAALRINYAVTKIINPKLKEQYPKVTNFEVKQAVGIDTSSLLVARTGIRGSNDLVWVGRAANYAAKLCDMRVGSYASWITSDVYKMLKDDAKFGKDGRNMWESVTWPAYNITVYRSSWHWGF